MKSKNKLLIVLCLGLVMSASHSLTGQTPPDDDSATVRIAALPYGVTSFGAIGVGEKIFLYGGHTGRAHSYSLDGISGKLLCLDTAADEPGWQEVSEGPKLQGLGLVAYDGNVYRVGGLSVASNQKDGSNKAEEKAFSEDETTVASETRIFSIDSFAKFDPSSKTWTDLPPLPEPRSSHDAVVAGSTVYVVGGWTLDGEDDENWLETAYKMDLSKSELKWEAIAPPFETRRAHSMATANGKIYLIGGMSEGGEVLNAVEVYDIKTNKWDTATKFPCENRLAAFGNSSFGISNDVYCLAMDGVLRKLSSPESEWVDIKTVTPRFFHRLVKIGGDLAIVGGTDMKTGFTNQSDVIQLKND